jgi:type III restriction enzyme
MSYSVGKHEISLPGGKHLEIEAFPVEYAEVYGVPFSFIPSAGSSSDPKPGPIPTRVRAMDERIGCEITFPRIDGYRYELPAERLEANFSADSRKILTTADLPTKVENAPIVGETVIHELDDLKRRRPQEVVFLLAKLVLERYFQHCTPHAPREDSRHAEREEYGKPWLFPDLLAIARRWMAECVVLHDNTFPQLLLLVENAYDAAERIYKGIVAADGGEKRLLPIPKPYDTLGSTRYVDFDTTRDTFKTAADKCHISHVVADTGTWEQKMAQTLEDMAEVFCYVKNQNLGFLIPYTIAGDQHNYMPDFLVRIDDGRGPHDPLNLIVEVTGEKDKEKEAKVSTAKTLWVPAVNNAGAWGRWGFIEIRDPWDAKHEIRSTLAGMH